MTAARAAYDLRNAASLESLNELREAAITAADRFTVAAAQHFT